MNDFGSIYHFFQAVFTTVCFIQSYCPLPPYTFDCRILGLPPGGIGELCTVKAVNLLFSTQKWDTWKAVLPTRLIRGQSLLPCVSLPW